MDTEAFYRWFMELGGQYGVNPFVFGAIYIGAIPFFSLSLAWLINNLQQKKSAVLPAILSGFFFISAYIYLIIAGKNVPLWVYIVLVLLIASGAWSVVRKVNKQTSQKGE